MERRAKDLLKDLESAINEMVSASPEVQRLLQSIRREGYQVHLHLKIAEEAAGDTADPSGNPVVRKDLFTAEDRRFLRHLKILE